jgi:hypothetical protein
MTIPVILVLLMMAIRENWITVFQYEKFPQTILFERTR